MKSQDAVSSFVEAAIASCAAFLICAASLVYAIEVEDHICFGASQSIESHPCNCYLGDEAIPQDVCYVATPDSPQGIGQNEVLDYGCNSWPEETCEQAPPNSAFSCGNVYFCKVVRIDNESVDVSYLYNPVCSTRIDDSIHKKKCDETDKGSCLKTWGSCSGG